MKIYFGLYSFAVRLTILIAITIFCFVELNRPSDKPILALCVFFVMVFSVLLLKVWVLTNEQLRIYSIVSFTTGNYKFDRNNIKKIVINSRSARGILSSKYNFLNDQNESVLETTVRFYRFEVKKSVEYFRQLNIEVEWED